MSSRREVLIRIALLQRKTLIKTKNCTLKCLNWHSSTVQSRKMLQCWRRTGHLPSFFIPNPGGFDSSRVPTHGNSPSKAKKKTANGGQPGRVGGWVQLELTDALILIWSQKGDFRTFPLPIFHHLGLNFPYNVPSIDHKLPKLSKLTVTRVECKLHSVTGASRYCVTGDCMRNNTLRSANTKYHYIFPSLQRYKTKEDLPLMYSCVFWCGLFSFIVWLL